MDEEDDKNFWAVYIGDSLTDRNVPPVTVMVTDTFRKCLLSGNPSAWKIFIKESIRHMEERERDEGPIY